MLISKFNKLIHNKIVWGAFAAIVSLAMVGLFTPSGGDGSRGADPRVVGAIYDQPVTAEAFARARQFALGFRNRNATTPEDRAELDRQAWRRLTLLHTAARMGIAVSDDELANAIQSNRAFLDNGRFDRRRYEALVQAQMKVRIPTFEAYFREEITLQKLMNIVGATLWVPPSDVALNVGHFTDAIQLKTVALNRAAAIADVKVSVDEARAFYEENEELFREPEAVSVRYVTWPISNLTDEVTVDAAEIEAYYDDNIESFVVRGEATNDTNTATSVYRPLAAVTNDIQAILQSKKAFFLAETRAIDFADKLAPGRYGQASSFEAVAKEFDRGIATSALFTAYGSVPDLDVGPDFIRAAFALEAGDPSGYYSYPVRSDDAVYVLATATNRASHIPAFSNVIERATDLAQRQAEREAFTAKVDGLRESLLTALESGTNFTQAAEALQLTVAELPEFSAYDSGAQSITNFNVIAPAVLALEQGELSEPIQLGESAMLAYVAARKPGSLATSELVRPEVVQMLQSYRIRPHFESWADNLVATACVIKQSPTAAAAADEDD
jgi:peptidyl-prolyl cis-trans isomerase D